MIPAFLFGRLAGPIASGVALALALALGVQTVRLAGAHGDIRDLKKERDAALTDLGTCKANTASLSASITAQNAALEAWNADGARRLAEAGKAVTDAQRGRAAVEKRAAALIATPPAGIDACARMMAADEAVMRSLR